MSGHQGHDHSHAVVTEGNAKKLTIALVLTTTFLIVEVIAGLITQSLALLSDAAHMFTDAAALAIALAAIKIAKRPADNKRTFGYQRFEILAALFNASMLFFVAIYILYEAYQRFTQPPEIQSVGMLIVASLGLVINLISMKILMSSAAESLNMKGAYLEVLSDALGSVGVIIGAVIIYYTNWYWVDTIIAVAIGFWVLPRTWILLTWKIWTYIIHSTSVKFSPLRIAFASVCSVWLAQSFFNVTGTFALCAILFFLIAVDPGPMGKEEEILARNIGG